jgi:hypothetical protein
VTSASWRTFLSQIRKAIGDLVSPPPDPSDHDVRKYTPPLRVCCCLPLCGPGLLSLGAQTPELSPSCHFITRAYSEVEEVPEHRITAFEESEGEAVKRFLRIQKQNLLFVVRTGG